jgi:hypothetical protein
MKILKNEILIFKILTILKKSFNEQFFYKKFIRIKNKFNLLFKVSQNR